MEVGKNLHEGHRERIIERFLSHPDSFSDHEILEVLLFEFIPRKDTNALAHTLISSFGSLEGVFEANKDQLLAVKGVGKRVATGIMIIGKLLQQKGGSERKKLKLSTLEEIKKALSGYFVGKTKEVLLVCLLDSEYKEVRRLVFEDNKSFSVSAEIPELAAAVATLHPAHAIVVHNHLSSKAEPSDVDDATTRRVYLLLEIHGIHLADHVIFSKNDVFSYYSSKRLDEIRNSLDLTKLLGKRKEY